MSKMFVLDIYDKNMTCYMVYLSDDLMHYDDFYSDGIYFSDQQYHEFSLFDSGQDLSISYHCRTSFYLLSATY